MTKATMLQVVDNIHMPDTVFLSPEDVIERYDHLIELLGIKTADECFALYDVIQDVIQRDKRSFLDEDKRICASILTLSGEDHEAAYMENEKNKEALAIKMIPFACYVYKKAESLALKEIEEWKSAEDGFKTIQGMLNKYHETGLCSSIMVLRSKAVDRECICGHPKDVLLMLAAAINGYLDGLKSTEFEMCLDEYLVALAEKMRHTTIANPLTFVDRRAPANQRTLYTSDLVITRLEASFERISGYLENIYSQNEAYLICAKIHNNVKCLLGGSEAKMKEIFITVINALIHSGYEPYRRFNTIASAIKSAARSVKNRASNNECILA